MGQRAETHSAGTESIANPILPWYKSPGGLAKFGSLSILHSREMLASEKEAVTHSTTDRLAMQIDEESVTRVADLLGGPYQNASSVALRGLRTLGGKR